MSRVIQTTTISEFRVRKIKMNMFLAACNPVVLKQRPDDIYTKISIGVLFISANKPT